MKKLLNYNFKKILICTVIIIFVILLIQIVLFSYFPNKSAENNSVEVELLD